MPSQSSTHGLRRARLPLLRRMPDGGKEEGFVLPTDHGHRLSHPVRAIRRGVVILLWTVVAAVIQAPLLAFSGRAKVRFARTYWSVMCRLLGLRVRVVGVPSGRTEDGRPVVFVSNHSSWLDVLVLGGQLEGCFVAKKEVGTWPVISLVARLGRTVFVGRTRGATLRERDDMGLRLRTGDNLILFPEGTTSDGSRVMPFRSAFMSLAELEVSPQGLPPVVQPISVVYDRLAFLPAGRAQRPLFAWYGDMDIGSHFWRLAQHRGLRATVLLHTPLDPRDFADRKALTQAAFAAVADGASALRQNRPAQPLGAATPAPDAAAQPAFA